MSLFKYREKRYGKLTLIIVAVLLIGLAVASIWGGVYAVLHMNHWSKFIILVLAIILGFAFVAFGLFMILMSFSMINKSQSVRDGNASKGIADTRLCDKCGRVITKGAHFCEHCGTKQETGMGLKICLKCKTKNSGTAKFCEKCGTEFEN